MTDDTATLDNPRICTDADASAIPKLFRRTDIWSARLWHLMVILSLSIFILSRRANLRTVVRFTDATFSLSDNSAKSVTIVHPRCLASWEKFGHQLFKQFRSTVNSSAIRPRQFVNTAIRQRWLFVQTGISSVRSKPKADSPSLCVLAHSSKSSQLLNE